MKSPIMEVFVFCFALALEANAQTPPVIVSQPRSSTNNFASAAAFTVVAANAATYQWQFNGANITNGPNVTGATNATLSLDDLATNQAGSYTVVVTSTNSVSTNSEPAVLTITNGTTVQITFSGYADGSASNVTVQLFDYDKPATVKNFLHYVMPSVQLGGVGNVPVDTNMAYSNVIWDRCIPNFVLQGGDYAAADRTNTTTGVHLRSLSGYYSGGYWPLFPQYIDNEFGVGPLIHNKFGTMAMAKTSGNPDSAANAFFFNLADNSDELDNQNGGYTVFGRVISNSVVLQYFNTLSKPNEGIFDFSMVGTNSSLSDLPVNDHSWLTPANTNLFFADFTNLSNYTADTNPPTVAVDYPAPNQTVTNADVVYYGTASDDVGVARVVCAFNRGPGGDANTVNSVGTSKWTADFGLLPPGTYNVDVVAQDGAGNISERVNYYTQSLQPFVVPRFDFTNMVIGNGTVPTNWNGTNNTLGSTYTNTAKPAKGWVFQKWLWSTNAYLEQALPFTMRNGMQFTACFISNNMPADGVSFTYPAASAQLTNATFSIKGKVSKNVSVTNITCQVFSATASNSVTTNIVISNPAGAWSTPLLTFSPGDYLVQAVAQDNLGRTRLITRKFTVLAQLTIIQYGRGSVSIHNGSYLRLGTEHAIEATPADGSKFLSWNAGGGSFPLKTGGFPMSDGLTLTVTFVSNSLPGDLTFSFPAANSKVTVPNITLGGKIASSVQGPQVVCQLFKNNQPLTGFGTATVTNTSWTLPVTGLPMGTYTAVAILTDAYGKTTLASVPFTVNFYPAIAGAYHGLFFDPTNVSETNAGYVSFTLSSSGVVDGSLKFPLHSYTLDVQADSAGSVTDYQPDGFSKISAYLTMNFDFTNFSGQMTGSVIRGSKTYPLTAYRAAAKLSTNTAPSPGKYVLSLSPAETNQGPQGDSFAAVTVSAGGNVAADVSLADDTAPFSFSTGVFTNGVWPLYAGLYKGNGMLIGWETNLLSGACAGTLYWIKNPTNGLYYTNGLDGELNSAGAKFVPPILGTNYQIVFDGGALATNSVTNAFSFKASGASYKIVPATNVTDNLTGSLLSTGVLKGSINNKTLSFSGAFAGPTNGGGFTLGAGTNTGSFTITLAPPE